MTNQHEALQQHALSALWPSMPETDFSALVDDIKANGQHDAGVLFDGQVLDGWHRYKACGILGLEFKYTEYEGEDPGKFVISKNGRRRHASASVVAIATAGCLEWRPRGGDQTAPGAVRSGTTVKEAAEAAGVSERTMAQAKVAVQAGLAQEVKDGVLSVKQAAAVAKLPKAKRAKAVKAIKDGENRPAPKKPKPDDAKLRAELIDVQGKYADLAEKNAELADTARELADKLLVFETTDPDEQQKEIAKLQKRIVRLEAEVQRVTIARNECQNKNNELIRQVRMLQKNAR